jgi:hypothetical protein
MFGVRERDCALYTGGSRILKLLGLIVCYKRNNIHRHVGVRERERERDCALYTGGSMILKLLGLIVCYKRNNIIFNRSRKYKRLKYA